MTTLCDALAARVRQLLAEREMTRYRLEKESGLAHSTLTSILDGKVATPTLASVYAIAAGFGLSVTDFLDCEGMKKDKIRWD